MEVGFLLSKIEIFISDKNTQKDKTEEENWYFGFTVVMLTLS